MIMYALEQLHVRRGVPCTGFFECCLEFQRDVFQLALERGHFKRMITAVECVRKDALRNILVCWLSMAKQDAAYFREYRRTKAAMKDNREQEQIRRGIGRVVEYMRLQIGARALTGYQAALMIERAMLESEQQSVTARREFVEALRGEAKAPQV